MTWGVIITGASRGYGLAALQRFAETCAEKNTPAHFLITARDEAALSKASDLLPPKGVASIQMLPGDLSDMAALPTLVQRFKVAMSSWMDSCDTIVLISNAGTLGDLTQRVADMSDPAFLSAYFNLNLVSCMSLMSMVLSTFKGHAIRLVNVSSLLALQAEQGAALYCMGKAARDMLHQVVAKEGAEANVKTLNYAPGPLDTDMQKNFREGLLDPKLRAAFQDMHAKGTLVKPAESADKMITLLLEDTFESGSHLDYYDLP